MNADYNSLSRKSVFIAICHKSDNKRQSKTLFLMILDLGSAIVLTFSIAAYPMCLLNIQNNLEQGLGLIYIFACFW